TERGRRPVGGRVRVVANSSVLTPQRRQGRVAVMSPGVTHLARGLAGAGVKPHLDRVHRPPARVTARQRRHGDHHPSRWPRKTPPDRVTITACSPHTSTSAHPDATTSVAVSVQPSYAHCLATTTTTSATNRSGRGLLRHTGAVG